MLLRPGAPPMFAVQRQHGKINFGVRIPVSGPLASRQNILYAATLAESLGFGTVWVHDQIVWNCAQSAHHVSSGSVDALVPHATPDFYESITTLAYLAGVTDSIRLGVAVVVLPLRNPIVLAKQLMNVDVMSRGRLIMGIGAGGKQAKGSFDAEGVDYERRGKITDDYLKAMLRLFQPQREDMPGASYSGEYCRFADVEVFPKPHQKPRPPIIVGGVGRPALRRTAEYADGWLPVNISAEAIKDGFEKIKVMAEKNGRRDVDFVIGTEIFTSIDNDPGVARSNSASTIEVYSKSLGRGGEDVTLVGSPEEIRKKIDKYVGMGVNTFELKFIYRTMDSFTSQLRLFATEVMYSFV